MGLFKKKQVPVKAEAAAPAAAADEAKAAAETLEKAQIRCRLELLKEDRAWHRYGNGGLGTRMCVLVAPSDYAAARKLVG